MRDQQLSVFVEVAKKRNFTRAAEALHMSQPAVSQYISSLENDLDVELIERNNKTVQLNKAGEIVLQYAEEILHNYERMELLVADLKHEPSGHLKIGASFTIGEYVLPRVLATLQQNYPLIIPEVTIGNTEKIGRRLLRHDIDVGLIEGEYPHKQIEVTTFATDEMYIYGGNGSLLTEKENITKTDLEEETWIIREEGSGTRKMVEQFLSTSNVKPKQVLTFGSTQIIKETIESKIGVSLLSEWTITKELKLGTVKKIQVPGTPLKRSFSIIKGKQKFLPKMIKVFEDAVNHSV